MKEFIIKDDPIKTDFKKDGIEKDFIFVTNDTKEDVKVEHRMGGFKGFSLPYVIDKRVKKEIVYTDIKEYDTCHRHYLQYLDDAYSGDFGIIIRPDFIWFTILCEIASIIKNDPETFRRYFSKSKDKEGIFIHSHKLELPIDEIMEEVLNRLPSDIPENLIVPQFTTLDEKSKYAFKCAFLDTVSPFYNYGVLSCGYNKIKVLGEQADYILIEKTLQRLSLIIPELREYYEQCVWTLDNIIEKWDDVEFPGQIASRRDCRLKRSR